MLLTSDDEHATKESIYELIGHTNHDLEAEPNHCQ